MSAADHELLAVDCSHCRELLDRFMQATHEVIMLNQKHLRAVATGEEEPHRFDLLIHAANERKQAAKYAYIEHRESHGNSSTNHTDEANRI